MDALPFIGYQPCPQLHSSPCRSGCSLPRCEAQDWGPESSEPRQSNRLVFLTFLGVMVGSIADHYEHATDETNDSPYSNTYAAAPANPGEYYDPSEQQ